MKTARLSRQKRSASTIKIAVGDLLELLKGLPEESLRLGQTILLAEDAGQVCHDAHSVSQAAQTISGVVTLVAADGRERRLVEVTGLVVLIECVEAQGQVGEAASVLDGRMRTLHLHEGVTGQSEEGDGLKVSQGVNALVPPLV